VSNHIRTCGTCGQTIGVGSDAVETIRKSAEKRVIDEVIGFIRAASKDWERLRGDYEKVAACIYIVDELKQKYRSK